MDNTKLTGLIVHGIRSQDAFMVANTAMQRGSRRDSATARQSAEQYAISIKN